MKSTVLFIFSLLFVVNSFTQKTTITIKGYAPAYIGKTIEVYKIQDYFSMTEELLSTTIVQKDSTFEFKLNSNEIQKIIIRSNKNKSYLYVQPSGNYEVFLPEKDKYDPFRPSGNTVELTLYNLDSNDINYKVLGFNRWVDDFIGNNYYIKNSKPIEFIKELDTFKMNAEKAYAQDTNQYFKTYVKFTFASLDEIQSIGNRNKDEKHDFYLKHNTVMYNNDVYMQYLIKFYENLMPRLAIETAAKVNLGIEKSSPTQIMKALSGEYTLINLRIREIAMIKMLSEEYYKGENYQTNILTILDSLSKKCMFKNNEIIAKNAKLRLLELVPGAKTPDINFVSADGSIKNIKSYNGKHVYLHFYNPLSLNCNNEIPLLLKLYETYKNDVNIITIYPANEKYNEADLKLLKTIPWDKFEITDNDPLLKSFKVENYPYYVLIDQMGYIVSSPSLGPQPNGQYETIEKTFYFIHDYNTKKQ
ncbi:MAG: thioredoxin family protein [Flavobacteriia bacterium]|nr:thioredoxin family protein [Flavobacteriia bacterium]